MVKAIHISIIPLLIFLSFTSKAQNIDEITEHHVDSLLDTYLFEDEDMMSLLMDNFKYQFLYARINYTNKSYFAGRDIGIDQFNTSAQLIYYHSSGLSLSGAAMYYSSFEPHINVYYLSLGYYKKFKSLDNFSFRTSYDRFFYADIDTIDEHSYNSSLNLGSSYRKSWGGSRIDASLLLGNETDFQLSWDAYADLTVGKIKNKFKVDFEPQLSLFFGSEDVIFLEIGERTGLRGRTIITRNYVQDTKFGLMNTELELPLSIDIGNFDLELAYTINFPRSLDPDYSFKTTGCFSFSIGYFIDLD